jgi:hypothetical protein
MLAADRRVRRTITETKGVVIHGKELRRQDAGNEAIALA